MGARILEPTTKRPWGAINMSLYDPDNNVIYLRQLRGTYTCHHYYRKSQTLTYEDHIAEETLTHLAENGIWLVGWFGFAKPKKPRKFRKCLDIKLK